MVFDVRELSRKKSLESGVVESDWLRALESARQSLKFIDIDFQSLEHFALASRTPERFTLLTRLIYQYGKSHPHGDQVGEMIFEFVNASPFALSDWIDAIAFFHGWLEKHGRKIDFYPMLKYLECCVASPEAKEGGVTFSALVEDMLTVIGYEG